MVVALAQLLFPDGPPKRANEGTSGWELDGPPKAQTGQLGTECVAFPQVLPGRPLDADTLQGHPAEARGATWAPTTPLDTQRVFDFPFGSRITSRLLFP